MIFVFSFNLFRTYGIVYKAQNKSTGTYVAIKKFKDSDDDEYVSRDIELAKVATFLSILIHFSEFT